jgi:hypothetical protein
MHRLERAARLAMGPLQDAAPEVVPPQPAFGAAQRFAVLTAAAIALAAAVALLVF